MRAEDEGIQAKYLREAAQTEALRMEEETKDLREAQIEERWKKYIQESAIEKEMQIQQLVELAEIRGSKGKKKKRGGGGGKKKKGK